MRLGILFVAAGVGLGLAGVGAGSGWLLLLWPAACFTVLGAGYVKCGAGVLGKRADGRRSPLTTLFFLPYFSLVHVGRAAIRALWPEEVYDEVAPGLFVGRRCGTDALPGEVELVVDLTAELDVPAGLASRVRYRCLPTLDGHAPPLAALAALVDDIADHAAPIYVHCAAGHGRSAMAAAALLVRRGLAGDVDEAERAMRRVRPRIRLAPAQRRVVDALAGRPG